MKRHIRGKQTIMYINLPVGHRNYPDGEADDIRLRFDGAYPTARIVFSPAVKAGHSIG